MLIQHRLVPLAMITVVFSLAGMSASDADQRGSTQDGQYVSAESRFGNGTVVGPVRRTRVGLQVKTPGGSWLHCTRSCSETLRVNTVDFWENEASHRGDAIDQEDGLLGKWLQYKRRY